MRKQLVRRAPALAAVLVMVTLLVTACSGPQDLASTTAAATLDNHAISMQFYLQTLSAVQQLNALSAGSALPSWQLPAGRLQLSSSGSAALQELVLDRLLRDDLARHHLSYDTKTAQSEDDQFFSQPQPQYQQMINNHILTRDIVDLLNRVPLEVQAVTAYAKTQVAHVRILTVKTKTQAQDLQQQLLKGGAWSQLSQKDSIDGAQAAGGDVPSLVPGVLSAELDQVIFQPNPDLKAITIVQSRLGYTLVQIVTAPKTVPISSLDASSAILPTMRASTQGAALSVYLLQLYRTANTQILVNWCGFVSGQSCPKFTFGLG